jgi:hypothetical protein
MAPFLEHPNRGVAYGKTDTDLSRFALCPETRSLTKFDGSHLDDSTFASSKQAS